MRMAAAPRQKMANAVGPVLAARAPAQAPLSSHDRPLLPPAAEKDAEAHATADQGDDADDNAHQRAWVEFTAVI